MEPPRKIPHIHEIVMDASCLDESTLRVGDKVEHVVAKTDGKDLCNDLGNSMNQTNWTVVGDFFSSILLWEQYNVGRVDPMKVGRAEVTVAKDGLHNIMPDGGPTTLEGKPGEAI